MKKFLGLLLTLALLVSSVVTTLGVSASASANSYDDADNYFLEFVVEDATYDGEITFTHNPLYNHNLVQNGREYIFDIDGVNGYALMVEFYLGDKVFYEIEELFYNSTSPFANCVGLPVYVAHNTYLEYKDQGFYDLTSGALVDEQTVLQCANDGFNYFGGTTATFTYTTEYIYYATKTTDTYSIQYDLPNITESVIGGSCAHTAGAIILTYYDRFCENIIPNFVPYINFGSIIVYRPNSEYVYNMTLELVDLMLIGEPHAGTTFSEFQLGMQTLVERQGYTYTTTNLFTNGTFNFNNYKNAVENNKPCAIFLTNFTLISSSSEYDGYDEIRNAYCPVSHVAAACGYKTETYYDANGNVITTRNYLKIASGLNFGIGYLNVGASSISKAISILVS